MGIGTSMGAFYEDSFHHATAQWDKKYDDNKSVIQNAVDGTTAGASYEDDPDMVRNPLEISPDTNPKDEMGTNVMLGQMQNDPAVIYNDQGDAVDYALPTLKPMEHAKSDLMSMKMPFPNNRNPDQDFNSRFGNLPPAGILNDFKPQNPDKPLARKI